MYVFCPGLRYLTQVVLLLSEFGESTLPTPTPALMVPADGSGYRFFTM